MEFHLYLIALFIVCNNKAFGHQQFFNVIPSGSLGQTLYSTVPFTGQQLLTTQTSIQPSVIQLLRQPQVVGQPALTQVVGQPGPLTQIVGGQTSLSPLQLVSGGVGLNGGGGLPLVTSLSGANALTATTTGLPYGTLGGATTSNLNGIPIILTGTSGLNLLNNGFQTVGTLPTSPYVQQPLVTVNPVLRQVPEDGETASVVELDPMDAALLDMENKGQMHMEKYAWGRSSLADKEKVAMENDSANRERKANLPVYLSQVPTSGVLSGPSISNNRYVPSPTRSRNPFIGDGGKRKKHFEHYEYFRNLDFTPHQFYVPMTVIPSAPTSSSPAT